MSHRVCICAECEAERRDAERYRYLRANHNFNNATNLGRLEWWLPRSWGGENLGQRLDQSIDAARISGGRVR